MSIGSASTNLGFSGLTAWQIVLQSQLCHPDWTPETHIGYLEDEEGVETAQLGLPSDDGPLGCVARWLAENVDVGRVPAA